MALISLKSSKISGLSGEQNGLPRYSLVYCVPTSGAYRLADQSSPSTADCVGIVTNESTIEYNATGDIQIVPGTVTTNWSLTPGEPVYLGTSGGWTQDMPTTGIVKPVGYAISAHVLFFKPDTGWEADQSSESILLSYFDDDTSFAADSDSVVPTQHATKVYVDSRTGNSSLTGTAGETLAQYDVVYASGGSYYKAQCDGTQAQADAVGIVSALNEDGSVTVQLSGKISKTSSPAWTWTPGGQLFVSTTFGQLTQTAPSTLGQYVKPVGFAISATEIYFSPMNGWIISAGEATHASTHLSAGTDEVDGDRLDIDYVPTNYTRTYADGYSTAINHLASHLKGIDDSFYNSRVVTPLQFGAKFDGSNDDTQAIQNAIDYLSHDNLGGTLYFPFTEHRRCRMDGTVLIKCSRIEIDLNHCRIYSYSTSGPAFNFYGTDESTGVIRNCVRNGWFIDSGVSALAYGAINVQDVGFFSCYGCYFTGFNTQLKLHRVWDSTISDNKFHGNYVSEYCIYLDFAQPCYINGNDIGKAKHNIFATGNTTLLTVSNNWFETHDRGIGVTVYDVKLDTVGDAIIYHNYFSSIAPHVVTNSAFCVHIENNFFRYLQFSASTNINIGSNTKIAVIDKNYFSGTNNGTYVIHSDSPQTLFFNTNTNIHVTPVATVSVGSSRGSGYSINDILTLNRNGTIAPGAAENSLAQVKVESLTTNNAVNTVSLYNSGSAYAVGTVATTNTTGLGSGCTIHIDSVATSPFTPTSVRTTKNIETL